MTWMLEQNEEKEKQILFFRYVQYFFSFYFRLKKPKTLLNCALVPRSDK